MSVVFTATSLNCTPPPSSVNLAVESTSLLAVLVSAVPFTIGALSPDNSTKTSPAEPTYKPALLEALTAVNLSKFK